jgi:hypothetical protein
MAGAVIDTLKQQGFVLFNDVWLQFSADNNDALELTAAVWLMSVSRRIIGAPQMKIYCVASVVPELTAAFKPYVLPNDDALSKTKIFSVLDIDKNDSVHTVANYLYNDKKTVPREFYPYLNGSVEEYAEAFLNSSSRALVLMGKPGTGKTSFIRELVLCMKRSSMICSDTQLLMTRALYRHFGASPQRILIVEDADMVVRKRENDNPVMAGILGILDGVVGNDKRIIISTNLESTNSIDEALLRPGRLFDLLKFKPLTNEQAHAARAAIDLPAISSMTLPLLTLAEALNYELVEGMTSSANTGIGFKR